MTKSRNLADLGANDILDVTATGLVVTGGVYLGGSAAANLMDDYEEGTWTPALTFGGGFTGGAYSTQLGTYTKIGNLVTATWHLSLSSKGSSTGNAAVGGLPFTSANVSQQHTSASCWIENISFADVPQLLNLANSTIVNFSQVTNAGARTNLGDGVFTDTSVTRGTISYYV